MDTSKTYIKMCEKTKEIQSIWHSPKLTQLHYEQGYNGSYYQSEYGVNCVDYEYESFYEKIDIWLPTQAQLQAMIGGDAHDLILDLLSFIYVISCGELERRKEYPEQFTSMEQLWLAFVMKERFNKVWNGTNWVKQSIK